MRLRRRVALNLSLAVLAAGLALFVLLIPPVPESDLPHPLVTTRKTGVQFMQVERAGKPRLQFALEAEGWALRAPVLAPAHPLRIRDLLALPTLPASARLEVKEADLARFGLNPPLARLWMDEDAFEFGITDGLDGRRYVRHQQHVHLIPDSLYPQLTQSVDFFIDTRLLKEGLRPERITTPDRAVWVEDGVWHSDPATGEPPADSIAPAWEAAEALHAASGTGEGDGRRITLAFARGITIEFDVMEQDGQVVLLRRDLNLRYRLDLEHARALMLLPGTTLTEPSAP